jgi:hypothetical protein
MKMDWKTVLVVAVAASALTIGGCKKKTEQATTPTNEATPTAPATEAPAAPPGNAMAPAAPAPAPEKAPEKTPPASQ